MGLFLLVGVCVGGEDGRGALCCCRLYRKENLLPLPLSEWEFYQSEVIIWGVSITIFFFGNLVKEPGCISSRKIVTVGLIKFWGRLMVESWDLPYLGGKISPLSYTSSINSMWEMGLVSNNYPLISIFSLASRMNAHEGQFSLQIYLLSWLDGAFRFFKRHWIWHLLPFWINCSMTMPCNTHGMYPALFHIRLQVSLRSKFIPLKETQTFMSLWVGIKRVMARKGSKWATSRSLSP